MNVSRWHRKHATPLNGRRRETIAHFLAYWNAQVVLAVMLGLMASAAVAQDWGPSLVDAVEKRLEEPNSDSCFEGGGRRVGDDGAAGPRSGQLFHEFSLDEMIPADHLLRRINGFATAVQADLHDQLKAFYSEPSIDPELTIRMLLIGYCYGIRHERRLCQEVALHLSYRWFCKPDLDDKVPHHSTSRSIDSAASERARSCVISSSAWLRRARPRVFRARDCHD